LVGNLHECGKCDIGELGNKQLRACCIEILNRYELPKGVIDHSAKVADVAGFIADRLKASGYPVDTDRVVVSALLHDVGKSKAYRRQKAVNHAEASAEIVIHEGLEELAPIVSGHILDAIISENHSPFTWEQKVVFYADKIVTHKLVSLEERFSDLHERRQDIKHLLDAAYEPTKALEAEVLRSAGISWDDLRVHFGEQ
jgi:putative nucleotidyltransferase with HDIG domain